MRRPNRTRRLSIAAMVALLAFVLVAAAGMRSFWTWDSFSGGHRAIGVEGGYFVYVQVWGATNGFDTGHLSASMHPHELDMTNSFLGFGVNRGSSTSPTSVERDITVRVPLWFPLLLLLIAPVRWLIARRANAPAFPVIASSKQG